MEVVEGLVQQWPFSLAERGQLRNAEEPKNLQRLQRQLRCLLSFGMRRDAQVLRIWKEELRTLEELVQLEEFAMRALRSWAVRALQMSLAVRALVQKPWACVQASWA